MAEADDRNHVGAKLTTLTLCALYKRTINLTCPRCQTTRRFEAVTLWWMFERKGWNDGMVNLPRRFACTACKRVGRVTRPTVLITRDRPDPEQPPYPDEITWKRVVSRYRS